MKRKGDQAVSEGGKRWKRESEPLVLPEEPQAPSVSVAETPAQAQAPILPPRPQFEICPVCGFFNKSVDKNYLVCKGDNDRYSAFVKTEAAAGKKPTEILSKIEWVLSQLDLKRFKEELDTARRNRIVDVEKRVEELLKQAGQGKILDQEIADEFRPKYQAKAIAEVRDGSYLVRRLWARLQAAQKLKPELEQMVEKSSATTS